MHAGRTCERDAAADCLDVFDVEHGFRAGLGVEKGVCCVKIRVFEIAGRCSQRGVSICACFRLWVVKHTHTHVNAG